METARRHRIALATAVAAAVGLVAGAATLDVAGSDPGSQPDLEGALLPDLDQETPARLDVRVRIEGERRINVLGFASAIRNIGSGPLVLEGNRLAAGDTTRMQADQIVDSDDGTQSPARGGG